MSALTLELEERLEVLDDLAKRIHENAVQKGFYETLTVESAEGIVYEETLIDDNLVGMKLALVHSEVTEVLEAIRKSQGTEAIGDEFADVLIRLLDLYHALRSTNLYGELPALATATAGKVLKNEGRKFRHGNKF